MYYRKVQLLGLLALFFLCLSVLAGCSATLPKPQVVAQTEFVRTSVPEALLTPVIPAPPMRQEEFLNLSISGRQTYLTDYALDLMSAVSTCNAQLSSVKGYLDKTQGGHLESQPQDQRAP